MTTMVRARVARWLIVVGLAFGVACMHSFGHLGPHHGSAGVMASVAGHDVMFEPPIPTGPVANGPGSDPFDVCLAVLTSILLLRLMVAAFHVCRSGFAAQTVLARRGRPARPPPRGLSPHPARLAVLRI